MNSTNNTELLIGKREHVFYKGAISGPESEEIENGAYI